MNTNTYRNANQLSTDIRESTSRIRRRFYMAAFLVAVFIAALLSGCSDDHKPTVTVTDLTPPPVELPEPTNNPVTLSIIHKTYVKFFDGENFWTWKTCEQTHRLDVGVYSCDDVIYYLNEYGQTTDTVNMGIIPDAVALDGSNVWTVRNVTPSEASAAGALPADYTDIFRNGVRQGSWQSRKYKTARVIFTGGDLFTLSTVNQWRDETGGRAAVHTVDDGFIVHDINTTLRTAKINDVPVSWATNHFNTAKDWQFYDGEWFSDKGYVFDGATLYESGSDMVAWRVAPFPSGFSPIPIIVPAGIRGVNMFWVECNSGYVVRYDPTDDVQIINSRLYNGDGTRDTGNAYKDMMGARVVGDYLYFLVSGYIYRHHVDAKTTAHFYIANAHVFEY